MGGEYAMTGLELRRGLMMAMAGGAQYENGTFTTGTASPFIVNFKKSYSKYLIYIEMTEESKTAYVNAGEDASRAYAFCGVYPAPIINNGDPSGKSMLSIRYNPAQNVYRYDYAGLTGQSSNSITIPNNNGQNTLMKGYSYNYYVVEMK